MVSIGELFVILVVMLIVFGPDKLPDLLRQMMKFAQYVKRVTSALTKEINTIQKHFDLEDHEARAKEADLHYQDKQNAE